MPLAACCWSLPVRASESRMMCEGSNASKRASLQVKCQCVMREARGEGGRRACSFMCLVSSLIGAAFNVSSWVEACEWMGSLDGEMDRGHHMPQRV